MHKISQGTGRGGFQGSVSGPKCTLCLLTYRDVAQRNRLADELDTSIGATERVKLERSDPVETEKLISRIAGEPGRPPVQVVGAEEWPEGVAGLADRLNLAQPEFAERCRRAVLLWLRDEDLPAFMENAPDLYASSTGTFEFHKGDSALE